MVLQDNDILLRSLKDDDAQTLAKLINNPKVLDNLRDMIPNPYLEKDAQIFINLKKNENPLQTFAIEHNNEFCGVIGLEPQKDIYRMTAEIGYWIGEPFWGKNIATKAVKLVTGYGLEHLHYIRLYAGVFEYNTGSMKVLEKSGYEKDCIFRKSLIKHDKIWNEHRYSITR